MLPGSVKVDYGDLAGVEAAVDDETAGVFVEPIQGEGGVNIPSVDFMRGLRALCDKRGLVLVCDEVWTGCGRTGRWFAYQHYDVQPDVVCIAKALGNGFPVAAVWARAEVAECLEAGDHGSTYGGNPLAMAAARKVLEILERDDMSAKAVVLGRTLADALSGMPRVTGVRGMGAMLAAELDGEISREVAARAADAGLLVNPITPTALRFTPPLTTSESEVDEAMKILSGAMQ
ncbi:MAG: aspartate aminotransferase family protein, partial [Acidimicrobiales bacterium]